MIQKRKKLLIVGSSGFLGRTLLYECCAPELEVTLLNREVKKGFSCRQYALSDLNNIPNSYDVVVNLAALIPHGNLNLMTSELLEANVVLPQRLIHQFPDAHHVYASSISVYKPNEKIKIDEDAAILGQNAYGISKYLGECLVKTTPKHTILRFSNLYGPGMQIFTFLPWLITTALDRKPLNLFGEGKRTQDYLYVLDAARMILAAINSPNYGIYNAVSGESASNLQVARLVNSVIPETTIEFSGPDPKLSVSLCSRKFFQTFGYKPTVSLEEGIESIVNSIRGSKLISVGEGLN